MRTLSIQELQGFVAGLEAQAATRLLVTFICHPLSAGTIPPGRFQVFQDAIEAQPGFRAVLLADDNRAIRENWARCLNEHAADVDFLHALAVLLHESIEFTREGDPVPTPHLLMRLGLWAQLLACPQFWAGFAPGRIADSDGRRREMSALEQVELRRDAFSQLLAYHVAELQRGFSAGNAALISSQLQCLDVGRKTGAGASHRLAEHQLPAKLETDETLAAELNAMAENCLDESCASFVEEARLTLTQGEPATTSGDENQNFAGAIRQLQPIVDARISSLTVLRASMHWTIKLCWQINNRPDSSEITRVLAAAAPVAEQLAPLCKEAAALEKAGQVIPAENKDLSLYYTFRGATARDATIAERHRDYQRALALDPTNTHADKLLKGRN